MYTEDDSEYRNQKTNNSEDYYRDYYDQPSTNKTKKKKNKILTKFSKIFDKVSSEKEVNIKEVNHKKHIVIIILLIVVLVVLSVILMQTIFVKKPPTSETTNYVRIKEEVVEMHVGELKKLNLILSSDDKNYRIEWFTNNETIVSVDDDGNVLAIKEGEAIILVAYYVDNKVYDAQATIKVLK